MPPKLLTSYKHSRGRSISAFGLVARLRKKVCAGVWAVALAQVRRHTVGCFERNVFMDDTLLRGIAAVCSVAGSVILAWRVTGILKALGEVATMHAAISKSWQRKAAAWLLQVERQGGLKTLRNFGC